MRNDVKLGLAIGGILLAVLIVYVLVVPGGARTPAQVGTTQQPADSGGDQVTLETVTAPDDTAAAAPPAAPGASFTPPMNESVALADRPAIPPPAAETPVPSNNGKQIDWNKLLNDQQTLIAETPVAAPGAPAAAPVTTVANAAPPATPATPETTTEPKGAGDVSPSAEKSAETIAETPAPTPAEKLAETPAAPAPTGQPSNVARTHVIQSGETLSSIAAAAYGDRNLYPAIIRANPGIDPNRLKVGSTLNLPAASSVPAPADANIASARIGPTIDASKQYRVVPGDSLHKISQKLYGKSDRADRIYDLNKKSIGEDPAKLKVGQVLDLPEAPTLSASR